MRINDIRALYDYNAWANTRILDTAAHVPAELFATAALGACNLRDTLTHLLVVESLWRLRWQGIPPESVEFPEEFPTLETLRARWHEEDRELDAFLAGLGDADLDRPLTYRRDNDAVETWTLWHLLLQVINHGTQHRAELALLLTALGHSPGNLDFLLFIRERGTG